MSMSDLNRMIMTMSDNSCLRIERIEQDPKTFDYTLYTDEGSNFLIPEEDIPKLIDYLHNRLDRISAMQRNLNKRREILEKKIRNMESQVDFLDDEES